MSGKNPELNWDHLLDGGTYVLSLRQIKWHGALPALRARVHYEASKRLGTATTHKIDPLTLEVKARGIQSKRPSEGCDCGARPYEFHVITCGCLGENAATRIGGPQPYPR